MTELYMAWTLRFVPDPARGEFINFGILAGRDGEDWALRMASDLSRARCISPEQPAINSLVHRLLGHVDCIDGVEVPSHVQPFDAFGGTPLTIADVRHMARQSYNALQFSDEIPSVGESADAVALSLFDHLVVEPTHTPRQRPHTRLTNAVTELIRQSPIRASQVRRGTRLISSSSYAKVDFTFGERGPVKLTQCLTFSRTDAQASRQQADTWSFFVQGMRERGAHFTIGTGDRERLVTVPRDIEVSVIFDQPTDARQNEALQAARDGWGRVDIEGVELSRLGEDLGRTARLLSTTL